MGLTLLAPSPHTNQHRPVPAPWQLQQQEQGEEDGDDAAMAVAPRRPRDVRLSLDEVLALRGGRLTGRLIVAVEALDAHGASFGAFFFSSIGPGGSMTRSHNHFTPHQKRQSWSSARAAGPPPRSPAPSAKTMPRPSSRTTSGRWPAAGGAARWRTARACAVAEAEQRDRGARGVVRRRRFPRWIVYICACIEMCRDVQQSNEASEWFADVTRLSLVLLWWFALLSSYVQERPTPCVPFGRPCLTARVTHAMDAKQNGSISV